MAERTERHYDGRYCNEAGRQCLDLLRGIVNGREKSSYHEHQCSHDHTAEDAEYDHLVVCILGILQFTCTQILSHHNTDTGTQLKIDNIEQVRNGGSNIQTCHHIQTSDGITLGHRCHTRSPYHLVHHQRKPLDQNCLQFINRDSETGVRPFQITVLFPMGMCPEHHDQCLYVAGNNGSQRCSLYSKLRERADTENQQIVQNRISSHRHKACQHRDKSLSGLFNICRIRLVHRKRDQPCHHDGQIFQAILQCHICSTVPHRIRQIQGNQSGTFRQEQ